MHWILQFFFRHRTLTSLLLTVALSVWMIGSSPARQMRTARFLTFYVFFPIQWTVDLTSRVRNIFAENERLRVRAAELNTRLALLEESLVRADRVERLLAFADSTSYDLVPVRIVGRDPSHAYRSIVVSAGRTQGIERYMPLVEGHGLVGRVVQVLPHLSLVQLLADPLSRTSVITRPGRVTGILESDGGVPYMRHRADERVAPGDTVCTSGLGGVYPKGLLVGTVEDVSTEEEEPLFARARVRLFVDARRLEEAFVMRLSPRWAAYRAEMDSLAAGGQ